MQRMALVLTFAVTLVVVRTAAEETAAPEIFCTIENDCHNHATAVTVENGQCKCTCRNSWTNTECQDCPIQYDSANDCGDCNYIENFFGNDSYPDCVSVTCEFGDDCYGEGTRRMNGNRLDGCICVCRNQWVGERCDICPPNYELNTSCGSCAVGFGEFPHCSPLCTNQRNCSGNAASVEGTDRSGCVCTCANRWEGANCSHCPMGFNASAQCGACITGWEGYPDCDKTCVLDDCGPNSVAASGTVNRGCNCTCRNMWEGNACETCPHGFDSTKDCGTCIEGYSDYPRCSRTCTEVDDCSDNSHDVSGTELSGCVCTCRNKWNGTDCSQCPHGYEPSNDCGTCIDTYDGYPNCLRKCTNDIDCSGNANVVTGLEGNCQCSCRNGWKLANCSLCTLPFGGSDCERCADGYEGFPNCVKSCSLTDDCNSHATQVTGFANGTCRCYCRNQWHGRQCEICPIAFNESLDCGACADDFVGEPVYPDCFRRCGVVANCSGHASSVTGSYLSGCNCTCRRQWRGPTCSECPDVYDAAKDCGECRPQFEDYPSCYLKCTVAANCSGQATAVTGNVMIGCNCTCRNQWYGPRCDQCPPNLDPSKDCGACAAGFDTYPGCFLTCTVAANCSGQATAVTGNTNTGCDCECRNSWNGSACDQCPPLVNANEDCRNCIAGFGGYPDCRRRCTNATDCNERAVVVSGLEEDCTCVCRNRWTASDCSECPPNFNQELDCGACNPGYDTYPNCFLTCTIPANCSGNAISVSGNTQTGCQCECRNQWSGRDCGTCEDIFDETQDCGVCAEGFDDYPRCARICTIDEDCSNQANTVTGLDPDCQCACRNSWNGSDCSVCASQFNRTLDCGACADGFSEFSEYPDCYASCTIPADCSNHATTVAGNTKDGCSCECRNQWTGSDCSICIANFSRAADCGACAAGFINYPECPRACTNVADCNSFAVEVSGSDNNCTCICGARYDGARCEKCAQGFDNWPTCARICTIPEDCSSQATQVTGLLPNCNCTCRNSWRGFDCGFCPPQFNQSLDCGECADEFKDFSSYPNCFATCTIADDCSGNADRVTGNIRDGCSCECRNQWTGSDCSICIANFSSAADCGACAPGYIYYPRCEVACTIPANCNDNAASVDGQLGNCTCDCRNQWIDPSCGTCPDVYDAAKDCGECRPQFEDYPSCYLKCTVAANCSGQATAVTGNTNTGCACTCRNSWHGAVCDQCPPLVDTSKDCGACIGGFSGYPDCARICTVEEDCSGNAVGVSGLLPDCTCNCRNSWSTEDCSVCEWRYNVSEDCGACIEGYDSYPGCFLTCTVPANCSNNADSVMGNTNTGCTCSCRNEWRLDDCSLCEPNYNSSMDCGECASGYDDYPRCARICTNVTDCSDNAANVSGLFPDCSCTCRNEWQGDDCSVCPPQFDRRQDCGSCGPGYEGEYPACYLTCTNAANCSGNAAFVVGNSKTGCNCTCRNMWNGSSCSECAFNYERSQDCGTCAEGYGGYPVCFRVCSTILDCNANARSTTGDWPNCTCNCRNMWNGSTCDECADRFDNNSDCGTCSAFFENYPVCDPACTNRHNCSNHASNVYGNITIGCFCSCRNSWNGSMCELCPDNIDPEEDCGACLPGFGGYPLCTELCTPHNCLNRSVSVSGNVPNCTCVCRHGWEGGNCSYCPPNRNETLDCDPCAEGYEDYPSCHRICTEELDCGSNAVNVSGNTGIGCNCTCRNQWSSANCSECDVRYNSSDDCGSCAEGYVDYPHCHRVCTSDEDCSGRATNVSGVEPNCTCTCRNMWNGTSCEICPSMYNPLDDCNSCARWHVGDFPNCTLMTAAIPTPTNTTSETLTVTQTGSSSTTPSRSVSRGTASFTRSVSRSPSATRSRGPTSTSTTSATLSVRPTSSRTATDTAPPQPPSATISHSLSRVPTASDTVEAASKPTRSPTQLSSSQSNAGTPSVTLQPSVTQSVRLPSKSSTLPVTSAPPPTRDPSVPCDVTADCSANADEVTALVDGSACACRCRNQWMTGNCSVCPPRFNSSDDCGSCSKPLHTGYPTCYATAHVVGGWMLDRSCAEPLSRISNKQPLLEAAEADLQHILQHSSKCKPCRNMVADARAAISAQMIGFNDSTVTFMFDVQIRNESVDAAMNVASCISMALNTSAAASGGDLEASALAAGEMAMNRTRAVLEEKGVNGVCLVPIGMETEVTLIPPCGPHGCAAADDEPPDDAEDSSSAFPWYFVVAGVVGVLLLAGLMFVARRIKLARVGARTVGTRAFADAGKYTVDFLQHAKDEELVLYSLRREIEFEDI